MQSGRAGADAKHYELMQYALRPQCPDEDAVASDLAAQVLPYALRHAWQFWVLRALLFSSEG